MKSTPILESLKLNPKYGFIKIAENPEATDRKTLEQ